MNATIPNANSVIGQSLSRVDGPDKVRGSARYAAEFDIPDLAHAALVHSTVAAGRIQAIDTARAAAAPGVLCVVTHENAPRLPYKTMKTRPPVDPQSGEQLHVFQGPEILFNGQPVAVVVARTLEQAEHAASLVAVTYAANGQSTDFDAAEPERPAKATEEGGRPAEAGRGDADGALAKAPVSVDVRYSHPREFHAAIEPHVTIAEWEGDRLTLHDKTQWVNNTANEIAHVFGMEQDAVRVISPFVGGAFGSSLRTWPHVTIAAVAARAANRPVRLELTRRELFESIGFRPRTDQHLMLGADRDGRLRAVIHEACGETSVYEEYAETTVKPSLSTYACDDARTSYRLRRLNTNTPCPMRGPGTVTGVFGLECAMDELAVALAMDPVELRLRNHADRDQAKGLPWSSKELKACYATAAERFGWHRRSPAPRAMRDGDLLIGWGMATAVYHANRSAASASATLHSDGSVVVRSAASDMGPGTYTSMTQVAADTLGLPPERVRFELGDTAMPSAPVHGGSITMASVGNAVAAACRALQDKLGELATCARQGPFAGASPDDIAAHDGGIGRREPPYRVVAYEALLKQHNLTYLEATATSTPGSEIEDYSSSAFGAVFVEVVVDPDLGTVRVPRMVGAYDVGRVVNPKVARSQCLGRMVQGLGMALLEQGDWDPRFGKVMNANLAEYLVPVCADVRELDVTFVPGSDTNFNPLGAKGLAEIAICGVAPAIANAVFHATGRRIRDLPITPDKLLL